jgi:hypothetical protein
MESDREIILPISETKLAEFILSLLGQRRTITKTFRVPNLVATYNWVVDVFQTLEQRVSQNKSQFVALKCILYFKSGKTITLYEKESFLSFSDPSHEESSGFDLNVTYLVEFPSAGKIEKQDVRIEVFSDVTGRDYPGYRKDFPDPLLKYAIQTTNLTWGEDISTHINNKFRTVVYKDMIYNFVSFFNRSSVVMAGLMSVLLMTSILFVTFLAGRPSLRGSHLKSLTTNFVDGSPFQQINQKLDALIAAEMYVAPPPSISAILSNPSSYIAVLAIALVALAVFLIWRYRMIRVVALNAFTQQKLERELKVRENIRWTIVVSLVVGICAGVLATRIDGLLFSH